MLPAPAENAARAAGSIQRLRAKIKACTVGGVSDRRDKPAVVLLSGGLDSATTLALAAEEGFICHALSFDYGQRHRFELDSAARVAAAMGPPRQRTNTWTNTPGP